MTAPFVQLKNNATGFISSTISAGATTIVLQTGQGIKFPTVNANQYFYVTLSDTAGNLEIVKVTARAGDTLTVVRGQDSTTARSFPALSRIELRVNAATIFEVIDGAISATPLVISNIASVIKVASDIDNVNTVAGNIEDVNDVADNTTNINTIATNIANVNAVGNNIANVNAVANNATNINLLVANETNVDIVAGDIEEVIAVGAYITNVNTVANDLNEPISEINTVAVNITNVNTVGNNISNVNAVGQSIASVNTVAPNIANVNTVAANITNVNKVAVIDTKVSAVAAIDTKVVIAANNVIDITNFADVYYGPNATPPTTRKDGGALQAGDMYYNTVMDRIEVYSGTAFDPFPAQAVARTFYVTMTGNDSYSGNTVSYPLATISSAIAKMNALAPIPCVTIVHPGEYEVQPDTVIPANCALYGYDLRVTKLKLPTGQAQNNMFRMRNGVKVRGFTFTNLWKSRI